MSRGGGGLAAGLATFNSCNKAGSIPHFTRHLQSHPTDYNALMWRGRAHSIVGNMESARVDFIAAGMNSFGPRRYVAQYFEASVSNDGEKSMKILNEAVNTYPDSHEVLGEVGTVLFMSNQYSTALPILEKTVSIIERSGKIEDPCYCWHQHSIGSIHIENKQFDAAERAFAAALNFSETHTVSHIGYAQVQLAKGKDAIARRHYNRARALNPTLVTWTTFEQFKTAVQPAQPATWYETFMNLPRTLGNMALSAIGMSGTPQNVPAPAQIPASTQRTYSSRSQSGSNVSAPRNSFRSPTPTSMRPTSASSAFSTSANQPSYNAGSSRSVNRTVSNRNFTSYGTSANQSSYTNNTEKAGDGPSSSRPTPSAVKSNTTTDNSGDKSTSSTRSNGGYVSSRQSTSRPYSTTGRIYPALPTEDQAKRPTTSVNQATWDGSYSSTVEAARKSRSGGKYVSQSSSTEGNSLTRNSAGASRGHGGGSGNGGDGGGSDDEDNESNEDWKKMRKESREILKYDKKEYVLSKDEKHYYSRDKAGHSRENKPFLKMYANKKNRLDFIGSLDRNFKFIEGKHESREGTSIRKAEMDVVRRR